jgi:hypothetical protein
MHECKWQSKDNNLFPSHSLTGTPLQVPNACSGFIVRKLQIRGAISILQFISRFRGFSIEDSLTVVVRDP